MTEAHDLNFEDFYREYYNKGVGNFINTSKQKVSSADAEDAVQQVFMNMMLKYDDIEHPPSYLFNAIKYAAMRGQGKHRPVDPSGMDQIFQQGNPKYVSPRSTTSLAHTARDMRDKEGLPINKAAKILQKQPYDLRQKVKGLDPEPPEMSSDPDRASRMLALAQGDRGDVTIRDWWNGLSREEQDRIIERYPTKRGEWRRWGFKHPGEQIPYELLHKNLRRWLGDQM